jgi:4-hydroxy-2-oxoheptanedioate aldolase
MGLAGFDWVCVDTQHGLIGYDQLVPMLQALTATGTPALVRVPWNEPGSIMKALDAGAQGVVIPMVNSPEEARQALAACRFPPEGIRSWGGSRTAYYEAGYDPESANRGVKCVIMAETVEAVDGLDNILSVPGIDAVYIGPNDLAISAGLPPSTSVTDPEHEGLVRRVLESCLRHGVVPGIHCNGVATTARWVEQGFRMLSVNSDSGLLRDAAAAELRELRGGGENGTAGSDSE